MRDFPTISGPPRKKQLVSKPLGCAREALRIEEEEESIAYIPPPTPLVTRSPVREETHEKPAQGLGKITFTHIVSFLFSYL